MQLRIRKTAGSSWISLLLTLFTTLIHSACCILPILAVMLPGKILPNLLPGYLGEWTTIFQYVALSYLGARIILDRFRIWSFHNLFERAGYIVMVPLVVTGLIFGHGKTEVQQLTEARLEMIRQHAQVSIRLTKNLKNDELLHDLKKLKGVTRTAINIQDDELLITYRRHEITEAQIFNYLQNIGYPIKAVE